MHTLQDSQGDSCFKPIQLNTLLLQAKCVCNYFRIHDPLSFQILISCAFPVFQCTNFDLSTTKAQHILAISVAGLAR